MWREQTHPTERARSGARHELDRAALRGVGVSLLLVSLVRAEVVVAQQYIAVEETAVDDVADIPDPGTLGLGVEEERTIVLTPAEEGRPPWIRDANFDLNLRAYDFERHSSISTSNEAFALGGEAMVETGHIADFVRIGAGYHFSKGVDAPTPLAAPTGLVSTDGGDISVLSSAFVKLGHDDRMAGWLGRHPFNLPYVNRNDSRMIPVTHEAYVLGRIGTARDWAIGHFSKIKPWGSEEFVPMSEAAGALGTDKGVSALGTDISIGEDTNVFVLVLQGWDTFSTYYAEGNWWMRGFGERELKFGAQYTRQASVGEQLVGDFDTSLLGLKVTAGFGSLHTRLSYTQSGRDAGLRSPWGGSPNYNEMMLESFSRAGERAWRLAMTLTGTPWGRPEWSGDVSIGHGYDARRDGALEGLSSVNEVDLTIDYRPQSAPLNGLWLRVRYAQSEFADDVTRRNLRVIVNYKLPVL